MIEFGEGARPSMALELDLQVAQEGQAPLTPANLFALTQQGPSWFVRMNGRVVALGGYVEQWPGRAVVWGYIGRDAGRAMFAMSREIKRQLDRAEVERYEAYAEVRHVEARRWLRLLGFRKDSGVLKKFLLGRDYVMFSKVR